MSIKITELPNLTSASLAGVSTAVMPIVADAGAGQTTYQTTIGNIRTYVIGTGNLNVQGAITANLTSTLANLIITGNLNVQGTTTTTSSQNLSTNSSIIDLHTFNSNLAPWTSDDGRDIGLRFFWYKNGSPGTSALVWENSNSYLTWYGEGVGNANTGSISGTLGTIQAGQLIVSNTTPATANATGALQVSGGISTGGNVYVSSGVYSGGIINSVGPATFANLVSNANVSVGTTLSVGGLTTVQALTSNSYATIQTTLVTGANATLNGLTVNNSITVGTTLGVTGNIIAGNVIASGSFSTPSGNISSVNLVATNQTLTSNLAVTNTANISTLVVTGATTLANVTAGNANITGSLTTSSLTSTGGATVTGTLGTTGNLTTSALTVNNSATVGTTLGVTGATVLGSTLAVAGITTLSSNVATANLAVTGQITATNNITAYYSDERLKTRIGVIENALDKIDQITTFYYEANELAQSLGYEPIREVGVGAQSVNLIMPEVVKPAPIDPQYLTVQYERLIPLLIEGIKELRREIKDIKNSK